MCVITNIERVTANWCIQDFEEALHVHSVVVAVYPSLDLSDNEEETKSRVIEKQDESWNPRGTDAVESVGLVSTPVCQQFLLIAPGKVREIVVCL